MDKLLFQEEERPIALQIFGHNPNTIIKAVKEVEKFNPDIIDINCGCPVKQVVAKGAGAALLKDPEMMVKICRTAVQSTSRPVTVKTRIGWDMSMPVIDKLVLPLQDAGIKAIALHARFARQMYRGNAHWEWFEKVKDVKGFELPLIGNGDINSPQAAQELKQRGCVDGVMIGRAAVGNPWLFQQIKQYLKSERLSFPSLKEKINICLHQLQEEIKIKGERKAILEMRKFYSGYFRGIRGFKEYRLKLYQAQDLHQVNSIMNEIEEKFS